MEKKTKQVTAFKQVEDGTRDVNYFEALDGKEFTGISAEKECAEYERRLEHSRKWGVVKRVFVDVTYHQPDEWYYAKDEEELEMIKKYMSFYDRVYLHINDMSEYMGEVLPELNVGEWMGCYYDSNDNGKDSVYIYTLDYLNSKIDEFRDKFE